MARAAVLLALLAAPAAADGESRLGALIRWYVNETVPSREEEYLAAIERLTGFVELDAEKSLAAVRAVTAAIRKGEHFNHPAQPVLRRGGPVPRFRLERSRVQPIAAAAGDFATLVVPQGHDRPYPLLVELGSSRIEVPENAVLLRIEPRGEAGRRAGRAEAWKAEAIVLSLVAHVFELAPIDPERVCLRAEGKWAPLAWYIALHNPDRFAGVLGARGIWAPGARLAANSASFRSLIIDKRRPDPQCVPFAAALREHRPDVVHVKPPARGGDAALLPPIREWFEQARRPRAPTRIDLVADRNTRIRSWWLRAAPVNRSRKKVAVGEAWTDTALARPGTITARLEPGNLIDVTTDRMRAFSLYLNEDVVDPANPVVRVRINGRTPESEPLLFDLETLLRDYKERRDPGQLYACRLDFRAR